MRASAVPGGARAPAPPSRGRAAAWRAAEGVPRPTRAAPPPRARGARPARGRLAHASAGGAEEPGAARGAGPRGYSIPALARDPAR